MVWQVGKDKATDWWSRRSGWARGFMITTGVLLLVLLVAGSVAAYTISKRNRVIRDQARVMERQQAKIAVLELENKKKDEQIKINKARQGDTQAAAKIKESRKRLKSLGGKLDKARLVYKKRLKDSKGMSAADQVKRSKSLLQDWL